LSAQQPVQRWFYPATRRISGWARLIPRLSRRSSPSNTGIGGRSAIVGLIRSALGLAIHEPHYSVRGALAYTVFDRFIARSRRLTTGARRCA
jgi:hypothetical protein